MNARFAKAWLSLTPEPEHELPAAIATLRAGGPPAADEVRREDERARTLVLRGGERAYVAWLADAAELAAAAGPASDPAVVAAAEVVRDVVANQAGLLLGLPDRRARRERAGHALAAAAGRAGAGAPTATALPGPAGDSAATAAAAPAGGSTAIGEAR